MNRRQVHSMVITVAVFTGIMVGGGVTFYALSVDVQIAWIVLGGAAGVLSWLAWRRVGRIEPAGGKIDTVDLKPLIPDRLDEANSESQPDLPFEVSFRMNASASTMFYPSTTIGPVELDYLLTGHELGVLVAATGSDEVQVFGFRAELTTRRTFSEEPVVGMVPRGRIQAPHFEVLLDANPPVIRRALTREGEPVRTGQDLPITVQPGSSVAIFLSPLTDDPRFTEWSLTAIVGTQEASYAHTLPVRTTAYSGWTVYPSEGGQRDAPGSELAELVGHWTAQRPAGDSIGGSIADTPSEPPWLRPR